MSLVKNNYLVIIPARSGSKSVRNKNIIDLNGKPIIQYTIDPALKLLRNNLVKKVIISTDSDEYKKIAEDLGGEVPFLRPKEISDDKAKAISYVLHALDFFKEKEIFFDAVIILQPVCPLRKYEDIVNSINIYNENPNAQSLITCYEEVYINDLVMYKKQKNMAIPLNPSHNKGIRRQEHGPSYVRNGAVYITSVKYLRDTSQIISDNPLMYEMPKIRSFDIDSLEDLEIIRKLI